MGRINVGWRSHVSIVFALLFLTVLNTDAATDVDTTELLRDGIQTQYGLLQAPYETGHADKSDDGVYLYVNKVTPKLVDFDGETRNGLGSDAYMALTAEMPTLLQPIVEGGKALMLVTYIDESQNNIRLEFNNPYEPCALEWLFILPSENNTLKVSFENGSFCPKGSNADTLEYSFSLSPYYYVQGGDIYRRIWKIVKKNKLLNQYVDKFNRSNGHWDTQEKKLVKISDLSKEDKKLFDAMIWPMEGKRNE